MTKPLQNRDSETLLSAILDNVFDGIITIDRRGIVESFNKAAEKIFGYGADEVIGRNISMLMPEPYHSQHDRHLENYLATGKRKIIGIGRETVGKRKDGTIFPIDLAVTEMELHGKWLFTGIVRDLSEQEKVERLKKEFISTVSHELRTPLTSIRGALGLVAGGVGGALPQQVKTLIDIALKNSERLILLVNDILDMEKIEAGKMEFQASPTDLISLLRQALEGNQTYAQQYHVNCVLAENLPDVKINVDANRLLQVLANLLSNAAKFSPPGGKVHLAAQNEGGRVRISVSDQGSGIPEEFRSQIFQKFAQADSSDTRKKGGTGLGLSITKAIVEQMGGAIGFESEPNVLTTFFVEFPLLIEPALVASPLVKGGKRILICEDDHDIAALLRLMLEQSGMPADVAHDANEAKKMLMTGSYQAMTVDLGLPGQDGIALIRELREQPETAQLPIVVVSANAIEGRRELKGGAFSVVDWINKPIDQDKLVSALRQSIGQLANARPIVLHVEDDQDIVQVVARIVEDVADIDNAACLADASRMLAEKRYDLVILDLSLPDGSGKELLPYLNRMSPQVPVMVFSAREMGTREMQEVGAVLVKSRTGNEELLATIKKLVGA